jgi:hypothetical protein
MDGCEIMRKYEKSRDLPFYIEGALVEVQDIKLPKKQRVLKPLLFSM